jgi:hypothetical protein
MQTIAILKDEDQPLTPAESVLMLSALMTLCASITLVISGF